MSLLRLLTAGKSLMGLKDSGNHYSLARRAPLPKFASKKNPFRASARPQNGPPPCRELPSAPNATEWSDVNSSDCNNSFPGSPIPAQVEDLSARIISANSFQLKQPVTEYFGTKPSSRWRALLLWMHPRTQKPAIPRFENTLVQAELSLEAVKVVRNDLSDSDLEVIPTKPVAAAPESKPAPATAKACANESSWERLTGRILGAGKT